jgi:hypothetical protein
MNLAAYFHAKTIKIQVSKTQSSSSYAYESHFLNLIRENHGLHEDDNIVERIMPTTFNEETEFLSHSELNSLKRHYITFQWKVGKELLDYIDEGFNVS